MQNLILNRYRPLETAGSGGFATVLAAWDTRIRRKVAIKCLRLDTMGTAANPATPREIPGLEEARTAAMLSDPAIVGVYDFAVQGGVAYLIMEYMDGMTLTELMRQEGPLDLDVATCVLDAVACALEVAHRNQVLHLDIKPDNVLINRQGQVKVADFGLAQLSHGAGYGQAAGGTIGYMPLEQMRLEAPDERTDEWALASLTYEMLMGENPFRAPYLTAAERAIEDAEIVIPSLAREDLDEEIDEALFGALAIDREDRFESIALFADAMLPHMGDVDEGARRLAVLVGDDPEYGEDDQEEQELGADQSEGAAEGAFADVPRHAHRGRGRLGHLMAAAAPRAVAALLSCMSAVWSLIQMPFMYATTNREAAVFWVALAVVLALTMAFPLAGGVVAVAAMAVLQFSLGSFSGVLVTLAAGAAWLALCHKGGGIRAVLSAVAAAAILALGTIAVLYVEGGFVLQVPSSAACASVALLAAALAACSFTSWRVRTKR